MPNELCNIKHGFGDQRCIRAKGHAGRCRCRATRREDGSYMYSEWESEGGRFKRHFGYFTRYPSNAMRTPTEDTDDA